MSKIRQESWDEFLARMRHNRKVRKKRLKDSVQILQIESADVITQAAAKMIREKGNKL